jgi:hypothetical protein
MMRFLCLIFLYLPFLLGGLSFNPDRSDVSDSSITSVVISIGTSQVEAKTTSPRNAKRQLLVIYNDSNSVIYHGPAGVTTSGSTKGIPLLKKQYVSIPAGDIGVYLIADSASNNVIVQEFE